jgi:drug/metabolite transporter (DMT)-like permease
LRAVHLVAVALLVAGQALLGGGLSALQPGPGEAMIFAATLLWSVEVVVAKRLLATIPAGTVALARMGGGAVVLVGYVLASGAAADLAGLTARHWAWVSLTGLVLAGYVTLWLAALSRARALDVTAVLVGGALVTASLRWIVEGSAGVSPIGAAFVAAGVVLVIGAARRRLRPSAAP